MMLSKCIKPIALVICASVTTLAPSRAQQPCGRPFIDPRLDVTMPVGCMSTVIIRKQIDHPTDLVTPRSETQADTARRLKALSDWREGTTKSATSGEGQK